MALLTISGLTAIGSSLVIFKTTKNLLKFNSFKKIGFADNIYYLNGRIRAEDKLASIVETYDGDKPSHIVTKTTLVKTGQKKQGVYYTTHKIGNTVTQIPHHYDYTDWTTIFNDTKWVSSLKLDKLSLKINKSTDIVSENNFTLKFTEYDDKGRMLAILKELNIVPSGKFQKLKIKEVVLTNNYDVGVIGDYDSSTSFSAKHIGTETSCMAFARTKVFNAYYYGYTLSIPTLAASTVIFINEIFHLNLF